MLTVFVLAFRDVLRQIDWALLLVFILMFIDLRLIAELPAVQELIGAVVSLAGARLFLRQ